MEIETKEFEVERFRRYDHRGVGAGKMRCVLARIFHRGGAEDAEKRQKQKGKERKIEESENSDRVSFGV